MRANNLSETYLFKDLTDIEKLDIAELIKKDTIDCVNNLYPVGKYKDTFYTKYIKRVLDIIISFPAFVITIPINIFLLIGTYLDVGRPVLFFQTRIGKKHRMFHLGKFRNMTDETDENGILLPASERVTKWGKFVRKTSLDELSNFWYILIGKMSIIGPRPMPEEYGDRFSEWHDKRHMVRPGLECPLHSEDYSGGMTWQNRFDNDVWYVENISFMTDVHMLWLLFKDAVFSTRREQRGKAEVGTFIGYDKNGKIIDSNNIPHKYFNMIYERRKK